MISIIIPVKDEGERIIDHLRDLFEQHNVEQCIVVDASEAQAFEDVREQVFAALPINTLNYIAATSKGRGAQMNTGAANGAGSVLLFLHADTRLPESALTQIQQGIEQGWYWGHRDGEPGRTEHDRGVKDD